MVVVLQLPSELGVESPERFAMGGMAELFRGVKRLADGGSMRVVVKHMLPQYNDDSILVGRFRDEADLGQRLHHKHIARVLDYQEVDGHHYMLMEEIVGLNLANVISRARRRKGGIPQEVAAYFIAGIASALSYMADATTDDGRNLNLIHRDISPSNILVGAEALTKLIDFGVARTAFSASRTETGHLVGKYAYMSPEQILNEDLDIRSDLYAVGAVAYELLSGKRAFQGTSDFETFNMVLNVDPIPLYVARPDTHPTLVEAVERCLRKDVDERYGHPQELLLVLNKFLHHTLAEPPGPAAARFMDVMMGMDARGDEEEDEGDTLERLAPPSARRLQVPVGPVRGSGRDPALSPDAPTDGGQTRPATGGTPSHPPVPGPTRHPRAVPVDAVAAPSQHAMPALPQPEVGAASIPPSLTRPAAPTEGHGHPPADRQRSVTTALVILVAGLVTLSVVLFVLRHAGNPAGRLSAEPERPATAEDERASEIVIEDAGHDPGGAIEEVTAPPALADTGSPSSFPRIVTLPDLVPINLQEEEEKRKKKEGKEPAEEATPRGPPAMGTIAIYSSAPVDVWVGGHFIGKTPIHLLSLQVGKHEFEFTDHQMGWDAQQTVAISAGPNRDIRLSPRAN